MRIHQASGSYLPSGMCRRFCTLCIYAATFSALLFVGVLVFQGDLIIEVHEDITKPRPAPKCSSDNQLKPTAPSVDTLSQDVNPQEELVILEEELVILEEERVILEEERVILEKAEPMHEPSMVWDPRFNGIPQNHPDLIAYIRQYKLEPPIGQYNLDDFFLDDFSEYGQSTKVDRILHKMTGGFFLEAGAADGELFSNTLFAERERGWTGLLVEPDPDTYGEMRTKGRNAYTINTCLSIKPTPHMTYFEPDTFNDGRLSSTKTEVEMQCLPLYSILLALNVTTIDYLSLDVVGYELQVLQTVPWDKMRATVISVERIYLDGNEAIENYMTTQGYVILKSDSDLFFAHPQLIIETLNSIITGQRH